MSNRCRAFPLEDVAIAKDGTGRTVEAFAAVFNSPAEVRDADGHYREQIHPRAFAKTLSEARRGDTWRVGVFYNHGRTLSGTPSDRASVPLGRPLHIEATSRGLLTVTRYNRTPLADEVLETIRNGDITGQSFTGRFLQSDGHRRGQKLAPRASGDLPLVTRTQIALVEYGPTPFPVYADAEITGVRALLDTLSDEDLERLLASGIPSPGTAAEQPPSALRSAIHWSALRAEMRKVI
jgi:HK97 family phage prohead protease